MYSLTVMQILKKYGPWLIIGMLIVLIVMLQQCRRPVPPEVTTTIIRDTIPGDSIPYEVMLPKPYPVYKDTGSTKWKYKDVDTCAILKDYFAEYYYSDTLKDDTSAFVQVNDIVTTNRLQNRKLIFQNRRPTTITTTITNIGELPHHKFYIGGGIGKSIPNFLTDSTLRLPISVLWITKNRWAYELEYDLFNNFATAKVYYKLSFKRKK
jgi:hypothetical protein